MIPNAITKAIFEYNMIANIIQNLILYDRKKYQQKYI